MEAHLCLRFVPALSHDFLWFIYNLCVPREVKGRGNRSKMTTSQDNPQQRYTMQTDPDVVNAIKKISIFLSVFAWQRRSEHAVLVFLCLRQQGECC